MTLPIQRGVAVLVDKNQYQRKLMRTLLKTSGFNRVTEIDSFEQGLNEANRTVPDFIFIDYDTAHKSELMRTHQDIRESFLQRSTYVIFLVSNPTRSRVKRAITCGAHWVVSRPFSQKCINRRIHALLDPSTVIRVSHDLTKTEYVARLGQQTAPDKMAEIVEEMDTVLKKSQHYSPPPKGKTQGFKPGKKSMEAKEDVFLL